MCAVNAVFRADFSSFIQAIDKAEVALVDFGKGAGKVESSLNKMVDNFSGRKLIQEASLMTIAIEQAGGTSKLTAKELEQVGAKANEAADKMRKLGYEVPAGLQKLADETKGATKNFEGLKSIATDAVLALGAFFTVRAGIGFAKDILDQASALQDLSNQTHIGVEDLQILAGAMSEFGVDSETLGRGLFTLSRKIATGDDSVEKALGRMGLKLEDVAGLEGEQLFLKMEHGLSELQGSMRDTTATELFGGKLGAAMAGASEGIDGALAAARRLNTVMGSETVKALDTFGESIQRAERNLTAIAATMIGPLAQGFNTLIDATDKGAGKMAIFWAMTKDMLAASTGLGTGTENLTRLLDDANQKFIAATPAIDNATKAQGNHAGAVEIATGKLKGEAKAVEDFQRILEEMDKTTFQLAMDHQKQWRDELEKTKDVRNKTVVDGLKQIQKAESDYADFTAKTSLDSLNYQILKIWQRVDEEEASFKGSEEQRAQYNAAVEALATEQAQALRDTADAAASATESVAAREVAAIKTVIGSYWEQVDAAAAAAGAALEAAGGAFSISGHRPGEPGSEIHAGAKPSPGGGTFANVSTTPTDPRILAYTSQGYTLSEAIALVSGQGGGIGPPHRAMGGPVSAGKPYMVGEKGPELFVPKSNGSILPNGRTGAGATVVTNNFYVNGTIKDLVRPLMDEITKSMKQGRQFPAA